MKNINQTRVGMHPRKGTVESPMEISNVHGVQDPFKTANHPVRHQPAGTSPTKRVTKPGSALDTDQDGM